jgi:mycothiol synthase
MTERGSRRTRPGLSRKEDASSRSENVDEAEAMEPVMRVYREDDWWRVRDFLRRVFLLNGRRELSWHVCRFDYWRWHGVENQRFYRLEDSLFIWETDDGQIAAVLNPEGRGEVFLQVHPGLRTPGLEEEMLVVAEERLSAPGPGGARRLRVWADERDLVRQGILRRRGYTKSDMPEYQRRRSVDAAVMAARPPEGYTVRALGDEDELPARSLASWRAFHPDEPEDRYEGWEWYRNIQRAPLYRRDLDIVAVAQTGEVASFCTVWFDDVTRTAYFEPVGTASHHRRRGLGKAVMCEGLRRLGNLGATMAFVGSYSPEAHALYSSVGFKEYDVSEPWAKEL